MRTTYFFYSYGERPDSLAQALRETGYEVIVDEEIEGDRHWHVAAVADDERESGFVSLAAEHGARYDGRSENA